MKPLPMCEVCKERPVANKQAKTCGPRCRAVRERERSMAHSKAVTARAGQLCEVCQVDVVKTGCKRCAFCIETGARL